MKRISIVGFGRFGRTLYRLLKDDFYVTIFDAKKSYKGEKLSKNTSVAGSLEDIYANDTVFFAVPISSFEKVIREHKKHFREHLLIDVLSVKLHPADVFKKELKGSKAQALLTHPLFGPDSSKEGFRGLPIVMDRFSSDPKQYALWKNYFKKKGLTVIEMSAREDDKHAAKSQGVTHFVGRMLDEVGFERTPIDTMGARRLHEVKEQTCNDTWELFVNLQNYNPYTRDMRLTLGRAYDTIYNRLLPERTRPGRTVFGIQGGVGSFNHEAILDYISRHNITNADIEYLYTTEKVMHALHRGDVDFGIFAIHNSIGGIVDESIRAIARYKFSIIEEFAIPVRHFLMKRKDIDADKLKTIMAHPQVIKQCAGTLSKEYGKFKLESGKGDLIDTARAAKALAGGDLPKRTAILGPVGLSKIYNLEVIAENLQDQKDNRTSFLLVKRS